MHISSLPCVLHVPVTLRLHPPTNIRCWRGIYKSWHFSFRHVSPAVYFLCRMSRSAVCPRKATIKILPLKLTRTTNTFTSHYFGVYVSACNFCVSLNYVRFAGHKPKKRVLLITVKNLGPSSKAGNLLRTSRGMYKLKKNHNALLHCLEFDSVISSWAQKM
jgi:hypothetical protein